MIIKINQPTLGRNKLHKTCFSFPNFIKSQLSVNIDRNFPNQEARFYMDLPISVTIDGHELKASRPETVLENDSTIELTMDGKLLFRMQNPDDLKAQFAGARATAVERYLVQRPFNLRQVTAANLIDGLAAQL